MRLLTVTLLLLLTSCIPQESTPTSSSLYVATGDILVSSSVLDSVSQFDEDGNFKRILWRTQLASETIAGLGWMHSTNEVLITVDGTPDRVVAVSVINGTQRELINNTNIAGTMRTSTQLRTSNDIIVSETTSMERTSSTGVRETYGTVWPSTVTTNVQDITALAAGGFATASTTTGIRKFPDSTATFSASATAAAPSGTTAAYGIRELSNGQFLVSWEGAATDYLSLYNADLTLDTHIVNNNQGLLAVPRGVDATRKGTYLVADNTFDYVLEVDAAGNEIQRIGLGYLDAPYHVLVVPNLGQ